MKKLATLLFIILLFGSGSYSLAQYSITQLTANSYADSNYEINDRGQIVWMGTDTRDSQVFFYDGNSTIKLTNDSRGWTPFINTHGKVVWVGIDGTDKEIFLYDGTGISQLTNNSVFKYPSGINEAGQVVWQGGEVSETEVFFFDGNRVTRLAEHSYEGAPPKIIGNGSVLWVGEDEASYDPKGIFLYDGTAIARITEQEKVFDPQINDHAEIVWRGHDGSDYEIYLFDGKDIVRLTNNSYDDYNPQINGRGQVVWMGYDGSDYEIFFYDGHATTQLTDNAYFDGFPQINDRGEVVWMGYDGSDYEIFLYKENAKIQLTDNLYGDILPVINNNGQVVWQHFNDLNTWGGLDREIFLATPNCASYNSLSGTLHIPCVNYNGISYWLEMALISSHFELKNIVEDFRQNAPSGCGDFAPQTNILHIPCVDVQGTSYWTNLAMTGDNPIRFDVQDYGPVITELSPVVTIEATDQHASESGPDAALFTVHRSNAETNADLIVHYTVDGTATAGLDYDLLPGFVTIPKGSQSATIAVTPIDDSTMDEGNETISLSLIPGNYIVGTPNDQTVTIEENDPFQIETVFQECAGLSSGQCINESCVDPGLERQVYDIWKERFLAIHGIDDSTFSSRFELVDVHIQNGPLYVWCGIQYILKLDWLRTFQSESIHLGNYPLVSSPGEDLITAAVNHAIGVAEPFDAQEVISVDTLHDLIHQKYNGVSLTYDFCNIEVRGSVWLWGIGVIKDWDYSNMYHYDPYDTECVQSRINLLNGDIEFFSIYCSVS